ncbi:MAG TPA: ABC transporter ATP-binding protein [Armatimonadota bacterium]|nr:ABC transporter ATP-binding protein [Armatimonadota bacterium]
MSVGASPDPVIVASALSKAYRRGTEEVRALDGVSFTIRRAEFVAVVGPSGSGKTTLLNLLGCLDLPSSGSLHIAGHPVQGLSERGLTRLRREQMGFVFQHFGLIPTLTVTENITLPTVFSRRPSADRVRELVAKVGLAHRERHRPHQLSGGEMQRVAIARALVNSPEILLADEPTGNLDTATGEAILQLFRELRAEGLTVVVVTHNSSLAEAADRRLELRDGRLLAEE